MKPKDWIIFALLGLAWGSSFLWIKIAVEEVGPFLLVAFRLLFGVLGLLAAVAISRPAWPTSRSAWIALAVLGLTNTAIPFVLISWGEKTIDSAVASVLNSTVPLFTLFIAHFFLRDDRLTLTRLAGLLLGFAGVVLLMLRGLQQGSQANLLGQGAVLVAAVFYAASAVYARRAAHGVSPIVQALAPLIVADLLIWPAAFLLESPLRLPQLPITWFALVWLGLVGSCLAYLMYFYLLHSAGPTRTILVAYTFPLVGVFLGVLFLNERLDWNLFLGGALVIASIWVVNRK